MCTFVNFRLYTQVFKMYVLFVKYCSAQLLKDEPKH